MAPTTDEIMTQLRVMLPELRTRFGVQRLGLYGAYTQPNASVSSIELLVECAEPLGLDFGVLRQMLAKGLGWSVSLHTPNMIPVGRQERLLRNIVYA